MVGNVTVVKATGSPSVLLRLVWFLFVGWWLGYFVLWLGWLLNLTILGLPLGVYLLNRLPAVLTLKQAEQTTILVGGVAVGGSRAPGFLVRAAYFVFIGSWFSLLWMHLAYLACVTVVGLPLGFWMFGRMGQVTTLAVA